MSKVKTETRRLLVTYEAANGGVPTNGVARDAALGGLFIETPNPLPVGALLTVELKAHESSVSLDARVFLARAKPDGPDHPAGMAVRFLDLPMGAMGKLQAILEHHRPPARTQLGVGEEHAAVLASMKAPSERKVKAASEKKLPVAATTPNFDDAEAASPPGSSDQQPAISPRHPTPRMIPVASPSSSVPSSLQPWTTPPSHPPPTAPMSSGQLPWTAPTDVDLPELPMGSSRGRKLVIGVVVVAVVVVLIVVIALAAR
jgi:hypothetical protein